MNLHLGTTALTVVLTVGGILLYGATKLYGRWTDSHRQSVRDKGLHPVTGPDPEVQARKQETR